MGRGGKIAVIERVGLLHGFTVAPDHFSFGRIFSSGNFKYVRAHESIHVIAQGENVWTVRSLQLFSAE